MNGVRPFCRDSYGDDLDIHSPNEPIVVPRFGFCWLGSALGDSWWLLCRMGALETKTRLEEFTVYHLPV